MFHIYNVSTILLKPVNCYQNCSKRFTSLANFAKPDSFGDKNLALNVVDYLNPMLFMSPEIYIYCGDSFALSNNVLRPFLNSDFDIFWASMYGHTGSRRGHKQCLPALTHPL